MLTLSILVLLLLWGNVETKSKRIVMPFPDSVKTSFSVLKSEYKEEVKDGELPYIALTISKEGEEERYCISTIIDLDLVLLTAECVSGRSPKEIIVVAGKAVLLNYFGARLDLSWEVDVNEDVIGVQERRVKQVFIHDNYDVDNREKNIALLRLEKPFVQTTNVTPSSYSSNELKHRTNCEVAIYSLQQSSDSHYAIFRIKNVIAKNSEENCPDISSNFICIEKDPHKKFCQGEPGSPLICNQEIVAIAAGMTSQNSQDKVCDGNSDVLYTGLYEALPWIEKIRGKSENPVIKKPRNTAIQFQISGLCLMLFLTLPIF